MDRLAARSVGTPVVEPWVVVLAAVAFVGWFAGHYPGLPASVGVPVWMVGGLALGFARPHAGLILTILVVPYAGGAVDPALSELLRVVPLLAAASRVLADRVLAAKPDRAPGGGILALAALAVVLFVVTGFTPYLGDPNAEGLVLAALPWLFGAPIAFLAAWIVGAHIPDPSGGSVVIAILTSTVVACAVALAAWFGTTWVEPFVFTVNVSGRLAAFGYAPPTGMAIAFALPIAIAAARRWHVLAAALAAALGLVVMLLTGSRGPLVALGVGALLGLAVSRRLDTRSMVLGGLIFVVAGAWLIGSRYPGFTPDQIVASVLASDSEDALRVQSWRAAVEIAAEDPLFGGGWRSLSRYRDVDLRGIGDSHNMVLSALANGGLPLGLAFGAIIGYSVWQLWANRHTVPSYLAVAAITVLVAGLWDIPQLRSYGAVVGGLALGMVARSEPAPPSRGKHDRRSRRPRAHLAGRETGAA